MAVEQRFIKNTNMNSNPSKKQQKLGKRVKRKEIQISKNNLHLTMAAAKSRLRRRMLRTMAAGASD